MKEEKRKHLRFKLKFNISSNELSGFGINLSCGGFGFDTDEEIIPAFDVPFSLKIEDTSNKYSISGKGNLVFSKIKKENGNICYYNGFEITDIDQKNKNIYLNLLNYIESDGK